MEAKDTVMNEREIQNELSSAAEAMEFIAPKDWEMNKALRIANLQAKISFRAGQTSERNRWVNLGNELLPQYPDAASFWQRLANKVIYEQTRYGKLNLRNRGLNDRTGDATSLK